ncbi:MAG: sporulation protein YqfD [Erysipelotrichaceae bacterium]|nr:sporulation protein YqfD [Erysipelotrichaceae bacterium]
MFKSVGYDLYQFIGDEDAFNEFLSRYSIDVYDITYVDGIYFYTSFAYRNLLSTENTVCYVLTTGLLGMFFRNCKSIMFYLKIVMVCCIWFLLQNTTFSYEIIGNEGKLKQNIISEIEDFDLPYFSLEVNDLKQQLFTQYHQQLSWLEAYKEGSKLYVSFSEKKHVEISELYREPLYATKDAVIALFDVQHGHKVVNIHDFVYEGSTLVEGYMLDSYGQIKDLYVKGKVYGYTWYTIESSVIHENTHDGVLFFKLLFDCRNQVSQYITSNEKIVKETILKYTREEDKVLLKVHYTLLEDITIP